MRIHVVDSNYLRTPALEAFLSSSRTNAVALVDLTSIEMHKGDAATTATKSTEIAHRFPRQVLVLRKTATLYTRRFGTAAFARGMVDVVESRAFARYGAALQVQSPAALKRVDDWADEASATMERLRADSVHIPTSFAKIASRFDRDEIRSIRLRKAAFPREVQLRLLHITDEIAVELFHGTGVDPRHWPADARAARDTIIYRYSLAMVLLYTRWVYFGRQRRGDVDKLVNDVVDMHVAAIGTFFSGVLSNDRNLVSVHTELRYLLRLLRGYVG